MISFISPVLSSVSFELQNLFLTFSVSLELISFEKIFKTVAHRSCNTMQIILVQSVCSLVTKLLVDFFFIYLE